MTSQLGSGSAIEDSVRQSLSVEETSKITLIIKKETEKSDYDYGDCD